MTGKDIRYARRQESFEVLNAIACLIPVGTDINGCAKGVLSEARISAASHVSGKATSRGLSHWRRWRVMRLCWLRGKTIDVRFERQVVDALLSKWDIDPWGVGQLLIAHKRQREAKAPWNGVRKIPAAGQPQATHAGQ